MLQLQCNWILQMHDRLRWVFFCGVLSHKHNNVIKLLSALKQPSLIIHANSAITFDFHHLMSALANQTGINNFHTLNSQINIHNNILYIYRINTLYSYVDLVLCLYTVPCNKYGNNVILELAQVLFFFFTFFVVVTLMRFAISDSKKKISMV